MTDRFDQQNDDWFDPGALDASDDDGSTRVLCARCGAALAAADCDISVKGSHRHTETNPSGFTFTVRLFASAPGCGAEGAPQEQWSWFPPYAWQTAHCLACGTHCGWRFSAGGDDFVALIETRIVEQPDA